MALEVCNDSWDEVRFLRNSFRCGADMGLVKSMKEVSRKWTGDACGPSNLFPGFERKIVHGT